MPVPVRVLLLSPLAGLDPANGDVTYTQQLLERPPEGVEYVDYATAFERGWLRERGRAAELERKRGLKWAGAAIRAVAAKPLNAARRRELIFREPLRFLEVDPSRFDLVHTHVFSVGYRGDWPPVVMSNSVAVEALYADGLGWSVPKVNRAAAVERLLARGLRIDNTTYCRQKAARLIAFTDHLKSWWIEHGIAPADDIDVVPICVEERPMRQLKNLPRVVGFFAGAPEIKGLDRAFTAFCSARQKNPDLQLHVAGADLTRSWKHVADSPGVTWIGRQDREVLLSQVLPNFDVMLHPTRFDGLPLSVLEAMSVGVPVITSDYRALPDIVGDSSLVAATDEAVGRCLDRLLDHHENSRASTLAQQRQRAHFSPTAVLPLLSEAYTRAITG